MKLRRRPKSPAIEERLDKSSVESRRWKNEYGVLHKKPLGAVCVISVCTAHRPKMLQDCLRSLVGQKVPPSWTVQILVVENSPVAECREAVASVAANSPITVDYVHEPVQGIPIARNRALEEALKRRADWIGFIDDDEIASPGWLVKLLSRAGTVDADVLWGPVEQFYSKEKPWWVEGPLNHPDGAELSTAATNNVLFRSYLVHLDGFGLRFDEDMRFTGGSDTDFFTRAKGYGARIVWVADAVVSESVPVERLSLRWQLQRFFRTAANQTRIDVKLEGYWHVVRCEVPRQCRRLLVNLFVMLGSFVYIFFGYDAWRRQTFKAFRRLVRAAGSLAGLLPWQPQPYKRVQGH